MWYAYTIFYVMYENEVRCIWVSTRVTGACSNDCGISVTCMRAFRIT